MSNISKRLKMLEKELNTDSLVDIAHPVYKKLTPKRSGNARNKTKKGKDGINLNYPYAKRLEDGYSRQAPSGMTDPTIDFIRRYVEGL